MRKGLKKEVELEYVNDEYNCQYVKWTIWVDTKNDEKKYLRLFVDSKKYDNWGNKLECYVFGKNCKEPRSLFCAISDYLYDLIMDKENTYDLFNDEKIERLIRNSY